MAITDDGCISRESDEDVSLTSLTSLRESYSVPANAAARVQDGIGTAPFCYMSRYGLWRDRIPAGLVEQ